MRYFWLFLALALNVAAQQNTADDRAIRAIEDRWDAANLKGDAAALEEIFADAFIMTGDDGKVRTKAEVIGELRAQNIKYRSAKTEELKIILHGSAAVVTGKWRGSYEYKGKTTDLLERFTNFYVRRGSEWRCVASHGSAIR